MIKKSSKKVEPKYVTEPVFEKHVGFVARAFAKVDERFNKVDERFNKVDERFDKMDERFDKMDERFDQLGKAVQISLEEMKIYKEEGREHRQMMQSLMGTEIRHERSIDDILYRVTMLEKKVK